jgi:hypothetical protein
MIGLGAGLMMSMQALQPVSDIFPAPENFCVQTIRRVEGEKDWPFVTSEGRLACVYSIGQPLVYFFALRDGNHLAPVVLDVNPLSLVIQSVGRKDVFLKAATPEELVTRIAPFVAMGHMLCKQKSGPVVPGNEL